ncbi:hypothetical protein ADUPG1_008817 [Aduncisulcus paluster]|uniref:Cytidyltransferase-like domain-containing protein n=1 Tax=Aduncisulcus paluster TaxID=2918883 RepID=A0ABQ5KTC2_9EUKA|nr:hypothetical protein ADUPG1_008817 [Aduncisulcus paluster]
MDEFIEFADDKWQTKSLKVPKTCAEKEIWMLVELIQRANFRLSLVMTGLGSQTSSLLLQHAGASRIIDDIYIPYSVSSCNEYIGHEIPGKAVSVTRAESLALICLQKGITHSLKEPCHSIFTCISVGVTGSLSTARVRRGLNHMYISSSSPLLKTISLHIIIKKEEDGGLPLSRSEQETISSFFILNFIALCCGVSSDFFLDPFQAIDHPLLKDLKDLNKLDPIDSPVHKIEWLSEQKPVGVRVFDGFETLAKTKPGEKIDLSTKMAKLCAISSPLAISMKSFSFFIPLHNPAYFSSEHPKSIFSEHLRASFFDKLDCDCSLSSPPFLTCTPSPLSLTAVLSGSFRPFHAGHATLLISGIVALLMHNRDLIVSTYRKEASLKHQGKGHSIPPKHEEEPCLNVNMVFELNVVNADKGVRMDGIELNSKTRRILGWLGRHYKEFEKSIVNWVIKSSASLDHKDVSTDEAKGIHSAFVDILTHRFKLLPYVALTPTATFLEKSLIFPQNSYFILGNDTITRVFDPVYYGGDEGLEMCEEAFRDRGIQFVAMGRCDTDGKWHHGLEGVHEKIHDICIEDDSFRYDISSTTIRGSENWYYVG